MALMQSGFYKTLYNAHVPMQSFLASLPISRAFWMLRDTGLVMTLGCIPVSILFYQLAEHALFPLRLLIVLGVAYLFLLIILRFPTLYGDRQSVLLNVIVASSWSSVAMVVIQ